MGGVDIAISDEVAATDNSAGNGAKDGLHEVTDIDESNQLATVAETQLYMAAYRVNQYLVILVTRAVYSRRAKDDIGEAGLAHQIGLGGSLALPIDSIGLWGIGLGDALEGDSLVKGTIDAEGTEVDELPGNDAQSLQGIYKMVRSHVVDLVECLPVTTSGGSGTMNDDVPCTMMTTVVLKLGSERGGIGVIQFNEVYATICQVALAAGSTHGGPCLVAAGQGLLYHMAPDKAGGTGDKNTCVSVVHL